MSRRGTRPEPQPHDPPRAPTPGVLTSGSAAGGVGATPTRRPVPGSAQPVGDGPARPARLWRRRLASADRRQPGRTARLCPAPWPFRSRPAVQRRPRPLHMKSSRRPASSWRSAGSPCYAAGHPGPCPTTTEARRAGQVTCLCRGPRRAPSSHRTRPGSRRGRLPQQGGCNHESRRQLFTSLGDTPNHGRVMFTSFGFWHRSWGAVAERDIAVRLRAPSSYETAYALPPDGRK
jgi:hypothetical protein